MSNLVSNSVQLARGVTAPEIADYVHQLELIRTSGIWDRIVVPALTAQRQTALSIVRSHASADPEAGATTAYNNGLLDGIEAALDLFGLDEKLRDRMREMTIRG